MFTDITLPYWATVVLVLLASVALLDRLIVPILSSIRGRFRRARVADLNTQLSLPISPFKLASRKSLVEQILRDPEIETTIDEEAKATGETRDRVAKRARGFAREIVPTFSTTLYFRVGTRMARLLSTFLYRVRVAASDRTALASVDPKATVVFVINHRSNMDYILVTYLVSRSAALSYAVGEWARVPVLAATIRSMGGYFIRRDSRNPLYRKVLQRYVQLSTASGVAQAVFPEGGLSRNGALQPARLGLLAYIATAFDPTSGRDIVFVPVGLNYDRVLEDRVLMAAATTPKGERPRFAFEPGLFLAFLGRNLIGRLTGTWHRYGYACVSFGRPVSLAEHLRNRGVADLKRLDEPDRFREIQRLGDKLTFEIGRAVPPLPVSLVAYAMLETEGQSRTVFELKGAVLNIMRRLDQRSAPLSIPRADQEYAIEFGTRMLLVRRILEKDGEQLKIAAGEAATLAFYANALVHHLDRQPWPVGN